MLKSADYLIVGQGLAGSILAVQLLEAGATVQLINSTERSCATRAAAGIYNPITGMRFVKTWLADEIFEYLYPFYRQLEQKFDCSLIQQLPVVRPLQSVRQQNDIIDLCDRPEISGWASYQALSESLEPYFDKKFGSLVIKKAGWVNAPLLLDKCKSYFEQKAHFVEAEFDYAALKIEDNGLYYSGVFYKKIIFCEGHYARQNPFFKWLPFNTVKGETLKIKADFTLKNEILLKGIFLLPTDNEQYMLGSTYNWADQTAQPTAEGAAELADKFESMFASSFQTIDHRAGIRPATVDRRPFIGLHPQYPALAIFNGFGSKGVSLCPYFAQNFIDFLQNSAEIIADANINRFSSLYLKSE